MSDFYTNLDLKYTEIAVLMTTCNKYEPGTQTFYLQAMVPLVSSTNSDSSTSTDSSNILNQNTDLGLTAVTTGSTIDLDLPKDVSRWYPKKWIPPGTRFIVTFAGGDITKPQITGRDF